MAGGIVPPTKGTPALLITVRGGSYHAGLPRSAWNHSTAWIRHILEDAWQLDLLVLEADVALLDPSTAGDRCRLLAATLGDWADGGARVRNRALVTPLGAEGESASASRRRRGHVR